MDPHNPYTPPPGYVPDYPGTRAVEAYELLDELAADGWRLAEWPFNEEQAEKTMMLYDGEIAYVDEAFGAIMDALEAEGLDKNTAVFVLNDHGEEFYDHGKYGHGHSLYPELIDMVWLARIPDRPFPEGTETRYVTHVDVMPTILDALGVTPPSDTDGRSLFKAGTDADLAYAFSESLQEKPEKKALRANGWLFISSVDLNETELYRLSSDPSASDNLSGRDLPEESRSMQEMQRYLNRRDEALASMETPPGMVLRRAHKKRLRGLGYIAP
jgi:arylsulfatase A-like enzyme